MSFVCPKCRKRYKNAGALATYKKSHDKEVKSGSLLQFFKKHSRKATTVTIELKPLTNKERTSSIKPSPPSFAPSRNVTQSKPKHPPAPPKRPWGSKNRVDVDSAHLQAPAEITAAHLDKRSPEFRVAHVRYFNYLKAERFPMIDKTMYFRANESVLGVKVRRCRGWSSKEGTC